MTPRGRYRIGVHTRNPKDYAESLGEKFSIHCVAGSLSDLIPSAILKVPARIITHWTLHKLKDRKICILRADALYLGMSALSEYATEYRGEGGPRDT